MDRAGGIRPAQRTRSRLALTLAEREEISRGLVAEQSLRSIARKLKRAPSTISREVKRNGGARRYRAATSDASAWDRAHRPKPCKLVGNDYLCRSLTWDRGTEMSGHRKSTLATNMDVFLCELHSPWQRGSHENTNRLLRQYFPKETDLSIHSQAKLSAVARRLNERPRKTLEC